MLIMPRIKKCNHILDNLLIIQILILWSFLGSAKASVSVSVVGKPSMPEDRLLVSNIHRNGCRLNWKETKDNGGLPIEYIVEKYIVAADNWSNYAQLSGTSIDVNDLETGKEYAFAVKAVNAEGESTALPTAKTMIAKDAFSKEHFFSF